MIDERPTFRRGLETLVREAPGLVFAGSTATSTATAATVQEHTPDVVLIGLRQHDGDGVWIARELATMPSPLPCLLISDSPEHLVPFEVTVSEAAGTVGRDIDAAQLEDTCRLVASGEPIFDAAQRERVRRQLASEHEPEQVPNARAGDTHWYTTLVRALRGHDESGQTATSLSD